MTTQERLSSLYQEQSALPDKAARSAATKIENAADLAVSWHNAQMHVLPGTQQHLRAWEADMRYIRSDIGFHQQNLARAKLLISWERGSWHRLLPVLIGLRIVAFALGIVVLVITHLLYRVWRWCWRNRQMILTVIVILFVVVVLAFTLIWILVQLPDLILRFQNSNP